MRKEKQNKKCLDCYYAINDESDSRACHYENSCPQYCCIHSVNTIDFYKQNKECEEDAYIEISQSNN